MIEFFEKHERVIFAVVYTAAVIVILMDALYWRPF
jgi:cadmium resistance protein CadD (predicted permease)